MNADPRGKTNLKAHLALVGASLIYGVTYVAAKQAMPEFISPFAFLFARIFGATILFWLTGLFIHREKIDRSDIPLFLISAFFGVAFNQALFLNGLSLTSPIDAAIIMTTVPIIVLIVARILMKEPVTLFKIIGIICGATGALLLILYSANSAIGSGDPIGNMMIIGNASSYAIYLVIVKRLLGKYHPVTVMKWLFLIGLLIVSGPGLPAFIRTEWTGIPVDILLSVLFVVVGATFLAYLFNNIGLRYVKPITVSIYIYSQPLIASVVAMMIGQDMITAVKIISAILVFTGVFFVSYSSSRTEKK